ncbi:hypothetical protein C5167_033451 [Papaver somniferum]|uniref:Uncharacterized protein n=1 Tax=Papaver somniferum TaxID=3469 RepID=A0A4Y7KAC3_PAPSO|nr:protein MICROTUBULE BINDING PROTEIN 2C-like [Papaver somniferum]RZC70313.1 hypothetical protein C5167_033451 [Papaver somniferum]
MYKHQHCDDVQDNGKSKAWLSVSSGGKGEDESSQTSLSSEIGRTSGSNVDGVLLQNLVEIVPLVESLMDQRPKSSFNRRASVIYTKTPSKEVDSKKTTDPKGTKKAAQSVPSKKHRDCLCDHDKNKGKNAKSYELPTCNSRASSKVRDSEEFIKLQERVEKLQRKLSEKDELLKSAQVSMKQMAALNADVSKMKKQVTGKDSLIEAAHLKLSDTQVKLGNKQATLKSLELEAKTSNRKVEILQEDLESMQREISAFTLLFEVLKENNCTSNVVVSDTLPDLDQLPYIDGIDENKMLQMEEVRKAYVAAVSTAKENQDEESVVLAAKMRLRLQSLVLGPQHASSNEKVHGFSALPVDMIVS